jgi:peptidyl-prolyl cis-trans isomerase C
VQQAEQSPLGGDRRAAALLLAGALIGIGLAAFGIARSGGVARLPRGAVAQVNGEPIPAESFRRFAAAVAAERREPALAPEDRRRLLERMIDEELLFQRGLALGLARHEPSARRAIVSAVIEALTSDAEAEEPSEAALRAFHAEAPERFTRPGRLAVDAAFLAVREGAESAAWERAADVARRLRAGDAFAAVDAELADRAPAPLPGGALALETLRQYLGPTAAAAAERLAPGEVSDPIRGAGGFYVLVLRERWPGEVAPYDEIRAQVRAEYLRTLGERALRETLAELREDAAIAVDEAALAAP